MINVLVSSSFTYGKRSDNAQWYGPDAPVAQPNEALAWRAASSFASCLLFPVPLPLGIPPTIGQQLSVCTTAEQGALFTNAFNIPDQSMTRSRLFSFPFDLKPALRSRLIEHCQQHPLSKRVTRKRRRR
jgi:hypothetical protein